MMKRLILIMMAAMVALVGISLAETAAPTTAPETTETQSSGLFGWISAGWNTVTISIQSGVNTVTDSIASGWNTVKNAMVSGWNTVTGSVKSGTAAVTKSLTDNEWFRTVEDFVAKNSATVSDAVTEGWNTLKQGAVDIGTVTWEKLEQAYNDILDWLNLNNPAEKEQVTEALDQLMQQLRAEYQTEK